MDVSIRVQDPSGQVSRDVVVRAQPANTVADLVDVLVQVLEWPRDTMGGAVIRYRARLLGSKDPLDAATPVAALQLKTADVVVLGPYP